MIKLEGKKIGEVDVYENDYHIYLTDGKVRIFLYKKGNGKSKVNIIPREELELIKKLPADEQKRIDELCVISEGNDTRFFYNNIRTRILIAGSDVIITKGWNYLVIYDGAKISAEKFNRIYKVLDAENELLDKYLESRNISFDLV